MISAGFMIVTTEASASADQIMRPFSEALEAKSASIGLSHLGSVHVFTPLQHPWIADASDRRGSFDRKSNTWFSHAPLDYDAWASGDYAVRVSLLAGAVQRGLDRVPSKRLTTNEREQLASAISAARDSVLVNPPPVLAPVDKGPWKDPRLTPPQEERLFKLYDRDDGRLLYREGWIDDDNAVSDHRGWCGERGKTQVYPFASASEARSFYDGLKAEARTAGFRAIPQSRHKQIVVELVDDGARSMIERRHALENFLDEELGWLGLGYCDGGDIGSGEASVYSFVVDYRLAEAVLRESLKSSPFADFKAIRRGAT